MTTLQEVQPQRPQYTVGALCLAIIAILGLVWWYASVTPGSEMLLHALVWGSVAACATSLGTLPVVMSFQFSQRANDAIIPALDTAQSQGAGNWGASLIVGLGVMLGAGLLLWIDKAMPHEHFIKGVEGGSGSRKLKRVWLFVLAICLHNFPEGLSIGVGFASPERIGGQILATGISVQDIPEGLVVALALTSVGYSRLMAVGVAVLSGLIEPLAAVIGVAIIGLSVALLPWGLAMAAGAMLFVISHEIIPESHRQGHESAATIGLILGFVLMMLLDTALG
jgi:ZIP family zinc transporter